jgi:DNA primase
MDVLSLHEAGIFNVVAPLGTAFTNEQADIIKRYSDNTILLFDGDQAGVNATIKAINLLEQKSFSIQVGNLSDGKDPGDILQKSGSQVLKNVVYSTSNALDFLLKQAVSRFPVSKPEGKEQAVEQLFDYIESVQSEVKKDGVFAVIAEYLDISVESLRRDYRQQLKGLQGRDKKFSKGGESVVQFSNKDKNNQVPKDLIGQPKQFPMTNDLFLMLIVVVNFQYFGRVRSQISAEDLRNPWACELYIVLEECFRNGELSSEGILSKIENQELIKLVLEKQALNEFSVNPEQLIADSIKQVKIDKLLQRRREVESQLKQTLVANKDQQMLRELLADKMYIDQALNKLKVTIHDRTAE